MLLIPSRSLLVDSGLRNSSEWRKLNDPGTQSYIADGTSYPILNNHLYSALLLKLKGPAADYATSRRNLHKNGITLMEDLRKTFKSMLTPADLIALKDKFRNHSCGRDQAIENFFMELETMQQEILDNGGHSTPELLKRYFIFNLGPDFSDIIRLNNMGTYPLEWQPSDLHSLIPVANRYLQSVLTTRQRNCAYKEAHESASTSSSQSPPNTEIPAI